MASPSPQTRARGEPVALPVGLEDMREQLGRNAVAFVAHDDPRGGGGGRVERDVNRRPAVAVLHRIGEQVRDDLLQPGGVAPHLWATGGELGGHLDPARARRHRHRLHGRVDDDAQVDRVEVQGQAPPSEPGEIDEIGDHARL